MLEKEFDYYLKHQSELVREYNGKVLVIKDESVIGVYDTEESAYFESQKKHTIGTFLIQLCTPGEEAYSQTFHSRVTFSNE